MHGQIYTTMPMHVLPSREGEKVTERQTQKMEILKTSYIYKEDWLILWGIVHQLTTRNFSERIVP